MAELSCCCLCTQWMRCRCVRFLFPMRIYRFVRSRCCSYDTSGGTTCALRERNTSTPHQTKRQRRVQHLLNFNSQPKARPLHDSHTLQYTVPTRSHLRQRAFKCRLGRALWHSRGRRRSSSEASSSSGGCPDGLNTGEFPSETTSRVVYDAVLLTSEKQKN